MFGDAEVDQRQGAQVLAQAGLRGVRSFGRGLQPLRLLGHGGQVPALAGQQQPDHPDQHLPLRAPAGRHRRRSPRRQPQEPLRLLQRSPSQLIARDQRRQLGIRRPGLGREPGQERVYRGGLPAQVQAGPVIRQQLGGQAPVPRRLGVADRLHRVPVPRKTAVKLISSGSAPSAVTARAARVAIMLWTSRNAQASCRARVTDRPPGPAGYPAASSSSGGTRFRFLCWLSLMSHEALYYLNASHCLFGGKTDGSRGCRRARWRYGRRRGRWRSRRGRWRSHRSARHSWSERGRGGTRRRWGRRRWGAEPGRGGRGAAVPAGGGWFL